VRSSPAKDYGCCVTSGGEIMTVWTTVRIWLLKGYKFLSPNAGYILNHKNNIHSFSRNWKCSLKKRVHEMQEHHGIPLQFSPTSEAMVSTELIPKPINYQQKGNTDCDWWLLLPFLLFTYHNTMPLVKLLPIKTISGSSIPASTHTTIAVEPSYNNISYRKPRL
jgi:hypothetical protein